MGQINPLCPPPCRCWCCRLADGVLLPPIYGSGSSSDPRPVGSSCGQWDDFDPCGSLDRTSSWLLRLFGEAMTATSPCEYHLPHPLRRCAGESSTGGVGVGSRCEGGAGSLVSGGDSSATMDFPGCRTCVAEVRRLPSHHGRLDKGAGSGYGAAAVMASLQHAPWQLWLLCGLMTLL